MALAQVDSPQVDSPQVVGEVACHHPLVLALVASPLARKPSLAPVLALELASLVLAMAFVVWSGARLSSVQAC